MSLEALKIEATGWRTLEGFDAVREIEGDLVISSNFVLNDVSALQGLTRIRGDVVFEQNMALDNCHIEDVLDAIGRDNIGGTIEIDDIPCRR